MSRKAKKRKNYAEEDMEKAIDAVKKKELSYLKSAAFHHVPVGTLHRLCSKQGSGEELAKTKLGRKPYLPLELERLLVEYAFVLETNYFGMTRSDLRRMAFQLALRNDLSHPFLNEIAGKKWLRLFRRRHPTVSLRIPEATSIARVRAFTKAKVGRFFDLLESEMEKLKFSPDRIYNVDETGLCIVQSKKEAVIALKGKKQVGQLTSAERGALITVIACMNPVGQYIPPFLIFPRVKVPASYLDGTPFNTDYDCHKSGWIQMDIFTKWFQHFLKYAKPTKELPVLLILDGHNTHTRNADVIELARKNNVVIISIPPHTSHKTQPLDRTFMGPLKAYYSSEVRKFLRDKKRAVELRDVGALFGSAYKNAARYDIAENGFKCTGIYPVNRNIFTDNEYTPTPEENDELQDELNEDQPALTTTTISPIPIPPTDLNATSASTTTSTLPVQIPPVDSNTTLLSSSFILPEQITPIPVLEKKKKVTRGRKPGKSEIITSSPYKNALAEQQAKSKYKPITGNKKPTTKNGKPATRNRKVAKLSTSNDDPTENQPSTSSFNQPSTSSFNQPSTSSFNPSKNRPVRKSRRQLFELSSSSESEDDIVLSDSSGDDDNGEDDDPECIYCNEKYSDGKEGDDWIRCLKCSLWFHILCTGIEDEKLFICEFCVKLRR